MPPADAVQNRELSEKLFELMLLEIDNEGRVVHGLDRLIMRTKVSMTKEQIAWVEKIISELYPNK
jgi:hypothetical protein